MLEAIDSPFARRDNQATSGHGDASCLALHRRLPDLFARGRIVGRDGAFATGDERVSGQDQRVDAADMR